MRLIDNNSEILQRMMPNYIWGSSDLLDAPCVLCGGSIPKWYGRAIEFHETPDPRSRVTSTLDPVCLQCLRRRFDAESAAMDQAELSWDI